VIELRQYIDRLGRNPFDLWFDKRDEVTQARVMIALDRLERGNVGALKSVGAGVQELRLDFGPGYRIYLARDGDRLVILLCGGSKKRQQTDIVAAQALWKEYKQRKQEA
jgi:putative addiction module killer protein